MVKDYYKVLGVDRSAGDDDIKRAYRKLALRYHPDKNEAPEAEERFKEVNEAYRALSEPKKREVYHSSGGEGHRSGYPSTGSAHFRPETFAFSHHFNRDYRRGFDEFFNSRRWSDPDSPFQQSFCAGGAFQRAFRPGSQFLRMFGPGGTCEPTFASGGSFKHAFHPRAGFQHTFGFSGGPFQATFRFCSGFGAFGRSDTSSHGGAYTTSQTRTRAPSSCYADSGSSQDANARRSERMSAAGNRCQRGPEISGVQREIFVTLAEVLRGCSKTVRIEWNSDAPDGKSVRRHEKVIKLNVKPGVPSGTKLTFQCPGDRASTESPPTITFVIREKEHHLFRREGADIQYVAKVTPWQAQWSTKIDVPTLTPGIISLPLAGPVTTGSIRRIEGQGLPYVGDQKKRGDLVVIFEVRSVTS